jgi:hypothetical protein
MDDPNSQNDEVLYHYCGAEPFLKIIEERSVWLSGISLANDTMEGRIVAETLMQLADESNLPLDQRSHLREAVEVVGSIFEGFAFCLSRASDQLSQWRGYAFDGAGYSIGFSRNYLCKLATEEWSDKGRFQLGDMKYEVEEHKRLAGPAFEVLAKLVKDDALTFSSQYGGLMTYPLPPLEQVKRDKAFEKAKELLLLKAADALHSLQLLKQSGFHEETEVRLITMATPSQNKAIKFRARGQDLVPYLPIELRSLDGLSPIREVWIGPKNRTRHIW